MGWYIKTKTVNLYAERFLLKAYVNAEAFFYRS